MNGNTVWCRLPVAVLALSAVPALAADIVINWESKGDPLCPGQVNWSKKANLVVTNVNDLLYTYHIYTRIVPVPTCVNHLS